MPKLAPKGVKICPGCPPKEIKPVTVPHFSMSKPVKKDTGSKVITLVNRSDYKHRNSKLKSDSLF